MDFDSIFGLDLLYGEARPNGLKSYLAMGQVVGSVDFRGPFPS